MTRKTYKIIETPSGIGEIRKNGEYLANLSYYLQVRQEITISEILRGEKDEVPGQISITGEITINENERMTPQVLSDMSSGEVLTLHLSDRRRLDIFVRAPTGGPLSGKYQITPYGSTGFISG